MSEELKPCPFCGSDDLLVVSCAPLGWQVECADCYATGPAMGSQAETREAWNRRAETEG